MFEEKLSKEAEKGKGGRPLTFCGIFPSNFVNFEKIFYKTSIDPMQKWQRF